jgi:hypothetical protein
LFDVLSLLIGRDVNEAIVVKCHHLGTAPLVSIVNKMVSGFTLVGSLTLNGGVGGLSPEVVEVAAKAGAKVIWMPTYSSVVDFRKARKKQEASPHPTPQKVISQEISLINESNNLLPQVISILEIIKENDMVLGTGHISVEEIYSVTARARQMGIKVTITHPLNAFFGSPLTKIAGNRCMGGMSIFAPVCQLMAWSQRLGYAGRGNNTHLEHRFISYGNFPSRRLSMMVSYLNSGFPKKNFRF